MAAGIFSHPVVRHLAQVQRAIHQHSNRTCHRRQVCIGGGDAKTYQGDGRVVQSAAAGDAHVGVSGRASAASGGRIEIARTGIADIEYGANVTRGALLTADGDGKAVTAADGNRVIGIAEVSGAAGDIGQVLLAPGLH